ncbi:major facilitator superfamily MFS_1 [Anaeromyxobacter dehalogenans 2CP-1]|uniref:Major facilitator superfamily MFS_1 n=1 Tax=Anaeromyxobacter dehalogenans (strain ATCC BAA-258 / DSM 21875 / 2CP-1) TaxID=455488 RepID=B8JDX9_ANAD2|nr:OFA family MFS transporter [Anaeromyxobacter dehalogenans]ACL64224.1 major facilitator superfamily MFS_1 [Anaeromyxobacter dehalogenans 2CP-1]
MTSNRWFIAVAGTITMACLGTVYSWSLFTQPLIAAFGWSSTTTTWAFALSIFFLGVGAILGGRWQDRSGPRPVAVTGIVLWGLGNVLAGLGTARFGAPWIYATYGVIGGLGLGLGYVTPVAAVTKWFPDKRGLGTGMVVMGFGLGAFIYNNLLKNVAAFAEASREAGRVLAARHAGDAAAAMSPGAISTVMQTFLWSGVVFAVVGGICALAMRNPTAVVPAPAAGAAASPAPAAAPAVRVARDYPPSEALRTPQFWALWAMLFLNVTAGILFISNAVPIMRELTGASPESALAVYGFIALFNGLGRFFWGAISDRIGRNLAYLLIYGSQVVIFFAVGGVHSLPLVALLFAIVLLDYGGGFGTMPSFTADYFGTKYMGVNYGWILLAWGVGGIVGPIFVARVKDLTGSFSGALPVIAVMLLVAAILPIVTRRPGAARDEGSRWRHLMPPRRVHA